LSRQLSLLDFFPSLSGPVRYHLYCWTLEVIQASRLQFQKNCFFLKHSVVCHFIFLVQFS
jgi:hypothetical protein